jgi:hypothetical protein
MAICKVCGKRYHACGNCGIEPWEYDLCTPACADIYQRGAIERICKWIGMPEDKLAALVEQLADAYLFDRWPASKEAR